MAKLMTVNGAEVEIAPKDGKYFSLDELQGYVDGYIEVLNLNASQLMIVNEEGRLRGLPVNRKATSMYKFDMVIAGTVVICDDSQMEK